MHDKLISFFQLYRHLPEGDQTLISETFIYKEFNEGDYLFKAVKVCQEFFFILDGILRIVVRNEKRNEVTHYFLKENQFCTILNSFNNLVPAQESIQAACPVKVLSVSKTNLLALYQKIPYLKSLIDEITQQALLDKINLRNVYLGQDSTTRYNQFMMRQPEIALRVQLSDIASYLGITPQSLSRIRKNIR